MSIEVRGVEQLERLSKALKDAGRKDLQRELSQGIAAALKPLSNELKTSALRVLPRRGGLAARVAQSQFRLVKHTDRGVRLSATNRNIALRQLDKGTVRHPVFGNRDVWVIQTIDPNWWSGPVEQVGPGVHRNVQVAMNRVARKIERSV